MPRPPALVALSCLALGSCGPDPTPAAADGVPGTPIESGALPERIVLITLDTLRADALDGGSMPRTRAFAATGLRFERFFAAAPSTQPTHASLFTGLHPWQHGVVRNGMVLGPTGTTLAQRLAADGWHTEAIVASYPLHTRFGFGRGFDRYDDRFDFERKRIQETWIGEATVGDYFYSIAGSITDKALAALDRAGAEGVRRHFLWLHYFDAHSPYGDLVETPVTLHRLRTLAGEGDPRLSDTTARARELYATDLERLDAELSRLFERLQREGASIRTHVLVTADHGESFGEEGAYGHDSRLTAEQVHVPSFLVSPRVEPATDPHPAGTVDAHATLLACAGLPAAGAGRDLAAPVPADRRQLPPVLGMGRYEPGKRNARFFAAVAGERLSGDEHELRVDDLASRAFDAAQRPELRSLFLDLRRQLELTSAEELVDPQTLEALEALGYTGE